MAVSGCRTSAPRRVAERRQPLRRTDSGRARFPVARWWHSWPPPLHGTEPVRRWSWPFDARPSWQACAQGAPILAGDRRGGGETMVSCRNGLPMRSRRSLVPTAVTSKKSLRFRRIPPLRRPRLIRKTPAMAGGGDCPCHRGSPRDGRSSGPWAWTRCRGRRGPVDRWSVARAHRGPPPLSPSSSQVCSPGRYGPRRPCDAPRATWGTAARRRTPRIPLFGSLTAAVVIGFGLARVGVMARQAVRCFERATSRQRCRRRKGLAAHDRGRGGSLSRSSWCIDAKKDTERAQFAQRFGAASAQLGRLGHRGAHRRCVRDGRGRR